MAKPISMYSVREMPLLRPAVWLILSILFGSSIGLSQPLPTIQLKPVATGLSAPLAIANAGDGSGRLFVVERAGRILSLGQFSPNQFNTTEFLGISSIVSCCEGERGMLGLAFHPSYEANGFFFVTYTGLNGDVVLSRFERSSDPLFADPASESVLLRIPHPLTNHNGGAIAFGRDGFLYMSVGDGGGSNDPDNNAQNLNTLLGKILRLDVSAVPYSIPSTNPFLGQSNRRGEIWAYGLRNPWKLSFDRVTGDLFVADVGQGTREEVNFQLRSSAGGQNYGWKIMEGSICRPGTTCDSAGLTFPILDYGRDAGGSVTGGYRYRGLRYPQLSGIYFYGDFVSGRVFGASQASNGQWVTNQLLDTADFGLTSFGEDERGELYIAHFSGGTIYAIVSPHFAGSPEPPATCDGTGRSILTLDWHFPLVSAVQVRLGSPSGKLFASTSSSARVSTGKWVTDGMTFYAQNSSLPLTAENTLATYTARVPCFIADPNPIESCDGTGLGQTSLRWSFPGTSAIQIRVHSPTGPLFAHTGASGSAATGRWVRNGMTFFAQNVSGGLPLTAQNTLATLRSGVTCLTASPNPVSTCGGFATTTVSWSYPGVQTVQIRAGSPWGTLFARGAGTGSATTGSWVRQGTSFFAENASPHLLVGADRSLGSLVMEATPCP